MPVCAESAVLLVVAAVPLSSSSRDQKETRRELGQGFKRGGWGGMER
jgi:hypothetical protein